MNPELPGVHHDLPPALLDVERLTEAIYAVSLTHGSYDWDWVLEDGVAAAIARVYGAKP